MSDYATYDDDLDDDNGVEALRDRFRDDFAADDEKRDIIDNADMTSVGGRGPRTPNREQRRRAEKANRRAARRELADGTELISVNHDNETYWVPADPTDWPIAALLAFEDGKAVTALRALLAADEKGRSGFDLLMSKNYRVADLTEIFDKVAQVGGFGNSGN